MVSLSKGNDLTVVSGVINPTHDFHVVLGGIGVIDTINVPNPDFCGFVVFISDGNSVTFTTSGNIGRGIGINNGASVIMVYDPGTSKWYPVNA